MATRIKLKNSVELNKAPTTTDIEVGELAINANAGSPAAYIRDSGDNIVQIAGVGSVNTPDASETVKGIAKIATTAQVTTGTDDTTIVTPAKLTAATPAAQDLQSVCDEGNTTTTGMNANGTITANLFSGPLPYSDLTGAPTIPTNNNELTNGAGYVTSSGNTTVGTSTNLDTSGADVVDKLTMTEGVITSHTMRTLTLGQLGYTGDTDANKYTHPSYNSDDFSINTGHLSGATVIDDIDINVTTDGSGHVTDCNGTVATRDLTLGDLGYIGATNANYITNNNQLTNGAGYVTNGSELGTNSVTFDKCEFINSNNRFYTGNDTDTTSIMAGRNLDSTYMTSGNRALILYHSEKSWLRISSRHSSTDNYFMQCRRNETDRFRIAADGDVTNHGGNYGQISDIKLKTDITDATPAWDDVKALRIRNFYFKPELDIPEKQLGFIAQEVEEIFPSLVKTEEDLDDDDNPTGETIKSIKTSIITLKAVKALQEAMERIEALEVEVKSLKDNDS